MTTTKVRRLATSASNPRRTSRRPRANPPKRRKMSDKQIKHFGTARQKAALKARRSRRAASSNSHRPRTVNRSPNPAWVVTLGPAINPNTRSTTVPATKRKPRRTPRRNARGKFTRRRAAHRTRTAVNPRRRRTRRATANTHRRRTRRNAKVIVRYRTKRRNSRRGVRRSRNPEIFGSRLGSKDSMKMIGGGIVGVAATKFLPTLIPATMMPSVMSTNLGRTAVSFAAALGAGFLASKVDVRFGQGVYFGGLMQAVSVGLNAFLPSQFGMLNTGLGDFAPGRFAVPQNTLRQVAAPAASGHLPAASGSRVTMSGLARAYAPAY